MYALEAMLCFLLYAGFETKIDGEWTSFFPWKREQVEWLPLCSYSALRELSAGQTDWSEEAVER